jgi:hypothetical protein
MSEENYDIFLLIPSEYLTYENYNDELDSNNEFFSAWSDNDTSDSSSVDSEDLKDFENEMLDQENEILDQENDNEIFEQELNDEVIDHSELTSCVVVDFIEGKIQRCGETQKLRQLQNLFGIWQVDRDAIKEVDGVLSKLGVCNSHFQFDNKYLHKKNKQLIDFEKGIIQ